MSETTCDKFAAFRYTWPGRDESHICVNHAIRLARVADAIGLYVQFIPMIPVAEIDHPKCKQKVTLLTPAASQPTSEPQPKI